MKKGIDKNKDLYYEEDEGNFYWVKQTPKNIYIEWIPHTSGGDELNQNVRWKELIAKKEGGKHPIKQNDNDGILIYPFQAGLPFYLVRATIEHINKEIKNCEEWGVSGQYYKNLRIFTWKKPLF